MRYPSLELGPEREPCPNKYNEASTLICPGASRLILQVSTHDAYIQCGLMPQGATGGTGGVVWQSEEPYFAGAAASLSRRFDAVRVRNRIEGEEAKVLISAG